MRTLLGLAIFLVLASAVAVGVYVYKSSPNEDETATQDAPIAGAARPPADPGAGAPVAPAGQANVDRELADYMIARELRSINGWRAFLAAHSSGLRADIARSEIEKLLHDGKTPAASATGNPGGASPDATAMAVPPARLSAASESAPPTAEDCERDGERLERLRASRSAEEAARFDNVLRCEKLRPQLLELMKSLGPQPSPPPGAEVSKGAPPVVGAKVKAAPSAETRAASPPDDICKRDEERLEQLHAHPSRDEAMRFADELRCETLRPQLLAVIETSGSSGPPPAASDASKDASPDAKTTVGTLPAAPPATGEVSATPDEYCKLDEERLERMQAGASMREAARFADELRCERLRPQILGLMERLSSLGGVGAGRGRGVEGRADGGEGVTPGAGRACHSERRRALRVRGKLQARRGTPRAASQPSLAR